jgi:hypothetical protein
VELSGEYRADHTTPPISKRLLTYTGDATMNGKIDADDYFLIDNAYVAQGAPFSNGSLPSGVSAVPEPAASLSGLRATAVLFARRQRRR